MATEVAGYPLIISSSMAVQPIEANLLIPYTLSSGINDSDIGHLEIKLMRQSNNQLLGDAPDGIFYVEPNNPVQVPQTTWEAGVIYKIQLRYGSGSVSEFTTAYTNFAQVIKEWRDSNSLSEWSNVQVVKFVDPTLFKVEIPELGSSNSNINILKILNSYTPTFQGVATTGVINQELITKCKFDLYDDTNELIETSSWIVGNGNDNYRFNTFLSDFTIYKVRYSVMTQNEYVKMSKFYSFEVIINEAGDLTGIALYADGTDAVYSVSKDNAAYYEILQYNQENGCAQIYLSTLNETTITGNYVLSRASEDDGYAFYQDIQYMTFMDESLNNKLIYQDFTVESGKRYRYALQKENAGQIRTGAILSNIVEVNLEYSYLYHNGVQLKLMLNQKMNSFKKTVLRTKQDTLGGKYPKLIANGEAYYAEFPISGLISLHMDEQNTFLQYSSDGLSYNNKLVIPARMLEGYDNLVRAFQNTGDDSIYNEVKRILDEKIAKQENNDYVDLALQKLVLNQKKSPTWGRVDEQLLIIYDSLKYHVGTGEDLYKLIIEEFDEHKEPWYDYELMKLYYSVLEQLDIIEKYETIGKVHYTAGYNLTSNNFYAERKFRECVESFLNNFEYKLYRSPSEGNIPVVLMNVSLTPQEQLGRMIYSFSATAYEIFDNTLENLIKYGILTQGEYQDIGSSRFLDFGQVVVEAPETALLYSKNDPTSLIRKQVRGDDEAATVIADVDELYYIEIENIDIVTSKPFEITLNNEVIKIYPYRKYIFDGNVETLSISFSAGTSGSLAINYKSKNKWINKTQERIIDKIESQVFWGQLNYTQQPQIETIEVFNEIAADIKRQLNTEETPQFRVLSLDIHDIDFPAEQEHQILVNGEPVQVGATGRYNLSPIPREITTITLNVGTSALIDYTALVTIVTYKDVVVEE